jgi:hypothetical protein
MEPSVEEQVELLLTKRAVVAQRPEGMSRDLILRALDDVIVKLEMGGWPGTAGE